MKAKSKKKLDQKMVIRVGALVLVVMMLLGVVFSTVGTQTTHDHVHYTEEELAALQALLDATGEDHSDHGHSAEEIAELLNDAENADEAAGEEGVDEAGEEAEEDHTGHDHE